MNRKELRYEIILNPLQQEDSYTLTPLPVQFSQIRSGWCALIEHAFVMGQCNPFAPVLMESRADGKAEVSDELKGAETFRKNVHILDLLTQEYDTDLRHVWNMMTSESEASYEPEELQDPAAQVYALEHSLELEKGWSAKLEAEVWQLKRKLRLLQARYERLRCKYKRPVKHLLTRSIEEMLYGKERMSPSIFKVSQS